jgi:hypothetical protein
MEIPKEIGFQQWARSPSLQVFEAAPQERVIGSVTSTACLFSRLTARAQNGLIEQGTVCN